MSERFSDEVLQRALDAFARGRSDHHGIMDMRAVLEGHLAEQEWQPTCVCDARLAKALSLAAQATNGWACYARTKREHRDIARLHDERLTLECAVASDGSPR